MPERPIDSPDASPRLTQHDPETVEPLPDPRGASTSLKTAVFQQVEARPASTCSTMLYHNGAADHGLNRWDRSRNRPIDCSTILYHNRARGLWQRGSIYHYRARVPLDLVAVLGKSHVTRSLGTGSRREARRLATVAAYDLHRYFEAVRQGDFTPRNGALPCRGERSNFLVIARPVTLGEAYADYLSDPSRKRSGKSVLVYRTVGEVVMDVLGRDTPLTSINRAECRELLDLLSRLPRNARKRWPDRSVRDAVALGETMGIAHMSIATANGHMNKFCALLNWAVKEDLIPRNPAVGLRLPDPVGRRDKRRPFAIDQLRLIFGSPLYTGRPRRAHFWVPLIALFTGMRLNEICQIDVADLRDLGGILCFVVTPASLTGHQDKRIKTASSERLVPVHPALVEFGFLDYLRARKKDGDRKLFPELPFRHGLYSHEFSRWFGRHLRNVGAAVERTCFHSFRHNFRDACREARIDREIALALGGWNGGSGWGDAIADHYGSGFEPRLLREAMCLVRYSDLDLSHLKQH
jgi:integrase